MERTYSRILRKEGERQIYSEPSSLEKCWLNLVDIQNSPSTTGPSPTLNHEAHLMECKRVEWPREIQNDKKSDSEGKTSLLLHARNQV